MIEEHPWKLFPKNNPIKKLIIGSFPPNKMVFKNGEIVKYEDGIKKVLDRKTVRFDFFYGSKENRFWDLFIKSLNININLENVEELKDWIKNNNWGLVDIVLKTSRKKDSPTDGDLIPIEWNIKLIEKIILENDIQSIYFTSSWVKKHFNKKINENCHIKINKYLLISPSPLGLMRIPNDIINIYPKNINEKNSDYRERYYSLVLNN
jgi:G:T/U-mismatch repair DNA glycosylase